MLIQLSFTGGSSLARVLLVIFILVVLLLHMDTCELFTTISLSMVCPIKTCSIGGRRSRADTLRMRRCAEYYRRRRARARQVLLLVLLFVDSMMVLVLGVDLMVSLGILLLVLVGKMPQVGIR